MSRTPSAKALAPGLLALTFLALLVALALVTPSASATIVLLSTSSGSPSLQDANLYDWRGQWTSALDRAAPLPGQLPPWQVNVGLFGDQYAPPDRNVVFLDPTCQINLQIAGAPVVQTVLNPCVEGPESPSLQGESAPVRELLTPNLAAAGNGPHTITITAYDEYGDSHSTSFNVEIDNILPLPTSMIGAVGWQRGGEVVSSAATTEGPSGIAGQDCSVGSATAGWYPGADAQLAVTGDGQIPVRCSAESNAGIAGASTEYDAMLDNSPPVGYFAPRNPNKPARASVDVADSLSGVAGGLIQLQTASGWQGLATSYNPATGQLTATIPDNGSLPDGNHALRAVVADAVGNTTTITSDVDGTPEIVTAPLRIVTQVRVGRSSALVKRCTLRRIRIRRRGKLRHQRVAAQLLRRCSQVTVPRKSGTTKLRFNQDAAVAGLVQTADGQPLRNAPVHVTAHAPGWRTDHLGTITTNDRGQFRYTIPAGPSRAITFSFAGTPTLRASIGMTTVRVVGKAKIEASRHPRAGGPMRVTGRVLGGYIPSGGLLVQLQYRIAGLSLSWAPFHAPVLTDHRGRWSVTFPIPHTASGCTYIFRALIAQQGKWPFQTAHSNAIGRRVT
jgi:hypothetical protein